MAAHAGPSAVVAVRHRAVALLISVIVTCLAFAPGCAADCTPLNALGSFNKAATVFSWDIVAVRTVPLTGISTFFGGPDPTSVATDCTFYSKPESYKASTLNWTALPIASFSWYNNVPTIMFATTPVLSANVTSGMRFVCTSTPNGTYHSIKYAAEPWSAGMMNVVADDGTLRLLDGGTSGPVARYFNGYLWYGSGCTPPPPAALPPPPPYALAPLLPGAVYVRTEAELVAAAADPTVTDIVVAASFDMTAQLVVNRASLRSITGDTAACASADGAEASWHDYDYSPRVTPSLTSLPRMCTLNMRTRFRHLYVTSAELTLAGLQFVNGRYASPFRGTESGGPGGSVFMADATSTGCNSTLYVYNCSFAGSAALPYEKGGAIAACNLVVDGSLFRENSASFGGDLYVSGIARISNSQFNQSVTIPSSGRSGLGGAIYLDNSITSFLAMRPSFITNCSFVYDKIYGYTTVKALGGAIYVALKAQPLVVNNSYIGGHYAISGGCIYMAGSSNLTLANTVVELCTATGSGGAIYAASYSFLTFINTAVRGNTALSFGGAVTAEQGTAAFAFSDPAAVPGAPSCSFDSNSVSPTLGLGGAFYLATFSSVWLDGCALRNNSAYRGGGIYASAGTVNLWQSYAPRGLALYAPAALAGSASDPFWTRGVTSRVVTSYFLKVRRFRGEPSGSLPLASLLPY
jgi:hypothetical protein